MLHAGRGDVADNAAWLTGFLILLLAAVAYRSARLGASGGVLGGGGGIGPSGRGAPDQDAGFGLLQPPAVGLFTAVVVPAQRRQVALAGAAALVMGLGVVQVAAGGPAAAARCGTGGVA